MDGALVWGGAQSEKVLFLQAWVPAKPYFHTLMKYLALPLGITLLTS